MLLQVICPQEQLVTLGALDLPFSARQKKKKKVSFLLQQGSCCCIKEKRGLPALLLH